jgi:hypothetical protein
MAAEKQNNDMIDFSKINIESLKGKMGTEDY